MSLSCKNCTHCGPSAHGNITCQHPSWEDEDAEGAMNEIHPSFASECSDYERACAHDWELTWPNDPEEWTCKTCGKKGTR